MKKLIVHIGAGKCGSSAIQAYLKVNAAALKAQGVLIPGLDLAMNTLVAGNQINFFQHLLADPSAPHICGQSSRPGAAPLVRERLAALHAEMVKSNLHTLILSAENLSNEHAFSRLLAQGKEYFDVHIVAYIRRQDEYLSSSWGQWYVKMYESIDAYLAARVPHDGNWHAMLSGWQQDFGRDHVHVRLFDRKFMHNGDVVDDFIKTVGLPVNDKHEKVGAINESNDERLISLAHRVQDTFSSIHDMNFYKVVNEVIGKEHQGKKSKPYLFDLEKRLEIMDAYAESNESIRNTFFPEIPLGTPLFSPPTEGDALDLTPVEKLDRDVSMLTRIVYSLAQKLLEQPSTVPLNWDGNSTVQRNPAATQTLGSIALPGSKVLKDALNSAWYHAQNPDIKNAGFDPYWHWSNYGITEGRLPAPDVAKLMIELLAERNTASQGSRPAKAKHPAR